MPLSEQIHEDPPRSLLEALLALYPFQPATAFWRWFEVHALLTTPMPSGRGLDLGCGDGKLTRLVQRRNPHWRLVGVDPDAAEIALARQEGLYEALHVCPGDRVPEADASFDFVFSNSVLEHIPDVRPVLIEARRLLRTGGQFVVTVPSADLHACLRGYPLPWRIVFCSSREEYLREFDERVAHRHYWTDAEWRHRLGQAGFSTVDARRYFNQAAVRRFEVIANNTSGVLYKLFGGSKRPIEIQRTLGLRRDRQTLPARLTPLAARLLTAGYRHQTPAHLYGGLLLIATA